MAWWDDLLNQTLPAIQGAVGGNTANTQLPQIPIHKKQNGAVSNYIANTVVPAAQYEGQLLSGQNLNDQQVDKGANALENVVGLGVGGIETSLLDPTAQIAGDMVITGGKALARGATDIVRDYATTGSHDFGGIRAGQPTMALNSEITHGLPGHPEPATQPLIDPKTGQPFVKSAVDPQNGDQFISPQVGKPLRGGTPAQIKARQTGTPEMQFVSGGAMKEPNLAGESTQPVVDTQSAQQSPPQETNPPSSQPGTPRDPHIRSYPAQEDSHLTDSAQKRGLEIDKVNIKDADHQKQVNATLDGYDITHDSHYNQMQANDHQLGMLSKNVVQHMKDNPGTISKPDLINDVAFDFMKNEMFPGEELATAERVVNSAFKRSASDATLTKRTIAPDGIYGEDALLMKTRAGDDSARTFQQPDDTKWTENQRASRILRDNLDKHIDTKWRTVARLNNDMSDMISAKPQLRENANNEIKANQKAQQQAGQQDAKQGGNALAKARDIAILGGTLYGGARAFGYDPASTAKAAITSLFPPKNDQDYQGGNISAKYTKAKPDANGFYGLDVRTTPNPTSGYITYQQFRQSTQGLTPGTPDYTKLENDKDNSITNATNKLKGNDKMGFMNNAQDVFKKGSVVEQIIAKIPPNAWNGLKMSSDLNAYYSNSKNPYAEQFKAIDDSNKGFSSAYQQLYGVAPGPDQLLNKDDSKRQMMDKLDGRQKLISEAWNKYQDAWLVLSTPTGAQTPQGNPAPYVAPQRTQQAPVDMSGGAAPLPKITLPPYAAPQVIQQMQ